MNAFEIYLGAFRSERTSENVKVADNLLNSINLLDFILESSRRAGEILSELFQRRTSIDLRDTIITGIVLVSGYSLVTRTERQFRRITGLSIEVW